MFPSLKKQNKNTFFQHQEQKTFLLVCLRTFYTNIVRDYKRRTHKLQV
jgi:hypothetical protein